MKSLHLLVWLTQLGLSVALPLGGFVLLAVWLRQRFDWGAWIIVAGVILGVICAVDGLAFSLKVMGRFTEDHRQKESPVSFNDHD